MALTLGELTAFLQVDDSGFKAGLGDAESRFGDFARNAATIAAGAAVGVGAVFAAGVMQAMDVGKANDKLAAQLGATGPRAAELGKVAGDLYAGAYGDSMEQVNEAIRGVMQQGLVMQDASSEQIEAVTAKVMDLTTAFDQDLNGATFAVGQMMKTGLAANADEAMDILTVGFQNGADGGQDLLDTFSEYPALFQRLGLSGAEAMGLIEQGMANGARNADLVADALKEFQIRATDGSKTSADAFKALGLNAEEMTAKIARGGDDATQGLDTILDRLRGIEDPVKRNAAAVGLFGTQAEDLGAALFALDPSEAVGALGEVGGAAERMGQTLNDNAATKIEEFKRTAEQAFVEFFGGQVIPAIEKVAGWLKDNLGPALDAVRAIIETEVLPALEDLKEFFNENEEAIETVATTISVVLLPALVRMGIQALVSGGMTVAGWGMSIAGAVAAGVVYVAQSIVIVARWVAMGVAAIANGALMVAGWAMSVASAIGAGLVYVAQSALIVARWILMGAVAVAQGLVIAGVWAVQIVAAAVAGAASFALSAARVVAGWVLMGAMALVHGAKQAAVWALQVVVAAASGAAAFMVSAGRVVAGWVLMATQATINALRMAAAWFIALGPVGWVSAIVIGLVILIIANWDKIVAWTKKAWTSVKDTILGVWDNIKNAVSTAVNFVVGIVTGAWNSVKNGTVNAWNNIKNAVGGGIDGVLSFVRSLPGRILSGLGNMGSLLYSAGGDLIRGFVNGIKNLAGSVASAAMDAARGAINGVKGLLGIRSPSRVFMEIGGYVGEGMAIGINRMQPAVAAEMLRLADTSAFNGLSLSPTLAPAYGGAGAGAGAGAGGGPGSGPLLNVQKLELVRGDPQEVARLLNLEARTRG